MTTKPTFAALIPNYNDSAQIATALNCALNQTIPFDEIIIIDDASTDNSVEIIEGLIAEIPQARLYRNERNRGVVATVNRGFSLVKSDYVHPISANDLYANNIVECGHRMLARFPDAMMISGNASLLEAVTGKPHADMIVRLPQEEAFISAADYIAQNHVAPVSLCGGANTISREAYQALGGQDKALAWYADWFLYFLMGFTHGFAYVPRILTTFRLEGEKSYSHARFDWKKEKPVLAHMLVMLPKRYPQQARHFKEAAIFPHYNLRILALAVLKPHRWFITPLFIWRCIGHQDAFWLKSILPRKWLMALRRWLRL